MACFYIATNQLHLTTFCIKYPPKLIAAFCVYVGSLWAKWEIPLSIQGQPFYYYIDKNITLDMLEFMKEEFCTALNNTPLEYRISPEAFVNIINNERTIKRILPAYEPDEKLINEMKRQPKQSHNHHDDKEPPQGSGKNGVSSQEFHMDYHSYNLEKLPPKDSTSIVQTNSGPPKKIETDTEALRELLRDSSQQKGVFIKSENKSNVKTLQVVVKKESSLLLQLPSKGIRSTVPLKIKATKVTPKDTEAKTLLEQPDDDVDGVSLMAGKVKKRVAHSSTVSVSVSQQESFEMTIIKQEKLSDTDGNGKSHKAHKKKKKSKKDKKMKSKSKKKKKKNKKKSRQSTSEDSDSNGSIGITSDSDMNHPPRIAPLKLKLLKNMTAEIIKSPPDADNVKIHIPLKDIDNHTLYHE
jgi:hypothetical protein